jgi:hypothetical protein
MARGTVGLSAVRRMPSVKGHRSEQRIAAAFEQAGTPTVARP